MRCSACQADNPPQNRFCDNCGTALEASCPSCGATLRPGARFCGACGQRLGETPEHLADKILKSRSALEGERRQVTVLFAERCFELITAEVHRFELARAQAEQKKIDEAVATARLAADTIAAVAARAPDAAVKSTFLAWPRVQAAMEDLERIRRA